jgi:hypothetical protein
MAPGSSSSSSSSSSGAERAWQQAAARLAHDVGKYVARTARNLPDPITAPLDGTLHAMLIADLYGDARAPRPAQRFAQLAASFVEPRLDPVRVSFAALDALESDVRAGQLFAVQRAAALSRDIEDTLRCLSREAGTAKIGRMDRRRKAP